MAKTNLKFFKGSSAPEAAIIGAIWFDTENRLIKVKVADSGENMWQAYSGLQNAEWDENAKALKLTRADDTVLSVNLSDVASASALSTLESNFNTLNTNFATEQGYIDILQSEMDVVEGKAAANEAAIATLNGADTVAGSVAKTVKDAVAVEAEIARAAEKANADAIDALETTVGNHTTAIAALQDAVGEGGSVDAQIKAAIEALDSPEAGVVGDGTFVDVTVKQVDGKITSVVVAENDIASAKGLADEITRATNAENAINAKIGGNYGTGEGQVTVAADIQAAKDAAAAAQADIDAFLSATEVGDATIDTLKEIQDWIASDETGTAALVNRVGANETAIATLNGDSNTTGSVAKAVADAVAGVNETIEANEKVTAEALTDLDGRVDALEAISAGTEISGIKERLTTLETEVGTNIPADIAAALADAKAYADGLAVNYDAAGTAAGLIAALDATATASSDYASFTVEQVDGKVVNEGSSITLTTGSVANGDDALAVASDVKSYVDAQVSGSWTWEEFA